MSGITVFDYYSWDYGIPSSLTNVPAFQTTAYVSGYAPHVHVWLKNNSTVPVVDPDTAVFFRWYFDDYYNDDTNVVSVKCVDHCIDHIYIMPGIYKLKMYQYVVKTKKLEIEGSNPCKGKYGKYWYWNKLMCNAADVKNRVTWDDTSCALNGKWKRAWDDDRRCFGKHCFDWSWRELRNNGTNPLKWQQTTPLQKYEKMWMYEPPDKDCSTTDFTFKDVEDVQTYLAKTILTVEVKEILPKASICSVTTPVSGTSPLEIEFTSQYSIPGSFPIESITWDFGDGTPKVSISRYSTPDPNIFTYTGAFYNDPRDPRNYNPKHTYTAYDQSIYYPSVSVHSENTYTTDSATTIIGIIDNPKKPSLSAVDHRSENFHLLKTRNAYDSALYSVQIENKIGFVRSNKTEIYQPNTLTRALCTITTSRCDNIVWPYYGNPGLNYPPMVPTIICDCEKTPPVIPKFTPIANPVSVIATITKGSVIVEYTVRSTYMVDAPLMINFTHTLSTTSNTTYPIVTAIPLSINSSKTTHTLTAHSLDFKDLTRVCLVSGLNLTVTGPSNYAYSAVFFCNYIIPDCKCAIETEVSTIDCFDLENDTGTVDKETCI